MAARFSTAVLVAAMTVATLAACGGATQAPQATGAPGNTALALPTTIPTDNTTRAPGPTGQPATGSWEGTLTASQTITTFDFATGIVQGISTSKLAMDVTFSAVGDDFTMLGITRGTASLKDTESTGCTPASGEFSGTIPADPAPIHTLSSGDGQSSGDGNLDLTIVDATLPDSALEPGKALSVTSVMSVLFGGGCGSTVATCTVNGGDIDGLLLKRTGADTFQGTCHEEVGGQTTKGSFDWAGEFHRVGG